MLRSDCLCTTTATIECMNWKRHTVNQHVLYISIKDGDHGHSVHAQGWIWQKEGKAAAWEEKLADLWGGSVWCVEVRCLFSIIKSFHSMLFIKSLVAEFLLWLWRGRHKVSSCPLNTHRRGYSAHRDQSWHAQDLQYTRGCVLNRVQNKAGAGALRRCMQLSLQLCTARAHSCVK